MIVVVVWGNCGGVFGDCGDGDDSCDISTTTTKTVSLEYICEPGGQNFYQVEQHFHTRWRQVF